MRIRPSWSKGRARNRIPDRALAQRRGTLAARPLNFPALLGEVPFLCRAPLPCNCAVCKSGCFMPPRASKDPTRCRNGGSAGASSARSGSSPSSNSSRSAWIFTSTARASSADTLRPTCASASLHNDASSPSAAFSSNPFTRLHVSARLQMSGPPQPSVAAGATSRRSSWKRATAAEMRASWEASLDDDLGVRPTKGLGSVS